MLRKFLYTIQNKIWIRWSNIRFKKVERFSERIAPEDIVNDTDDILRLAKKIYKNFKYKSDGADQLWDAVLPPCYAYKQYKNKDVFKEDCDGFHALLYHCLVQSSIESYLMSVQTKKSGHCVLVFRLERIWYVIDYDSIYQAGRSLSEMIDNYNSVYSNHYEENKLKVKFNGFYSYNYKKGKYKMINLLK